MPASGDGDATTDHTVGRYSPSIELAQLEQRVVHFHHSPASVAVLKPTEIQRLALCVACTQAGGLLYHIISASYSVGSV